MTLDEWQKVTDIAVKGIAAVGIAGLTLWFTAERFEADKSKLCTESIDRTFEMVIKNKFSESYKAMLDWRIKVHEGVCGALDKKMIDMLNNAFQPPALLADIPAGPKLSAGASKANSIPAKTNAANVQWVAFSRRNDLSYSAINFDVAQGEKSRPTATGNILSARWFVNIRPKNTPVTNGDNPVVGQINGGECVVVVEHVSGELNEWIKISRSACP